MTILPSTVKYIDCWCGNKFDTYDEAVASAKVNAHQNETDVSIAKVIAIARYPFPNISIETLDQPVPATP
jgi:hypothetical protein